MNNYLTPKDVAGILRISYDNALKIMKYSDIGAIRIGRQYRVSEEQLQKYLNSKAGKSIDLSVEQDYMSIYNNMSKIKRRKF